MVRDMLNAPISFKMTTYRKRSHVHAKLFLNALFLQLRSIRINAVLIHDLDEIEDVMT